MVFSGGLNLERVFNSFFGLKKQDSGKGYLNTLFLSCLRNFGGEQSGFKKNIVAAILPSVRYTVKKILSNNALINTLVPMVKPHVKARVINKTVIKCVHWAIAHMDAFYISENFLKSFLPEPNIGHYPFGTLDEREIETSSVCWWKGKEVNSYGEIFFQ